MRLVGQAIRGGTAEGRVALEPGHPTLPAGPPVIAAFGALPAADRRLAGAHGWVGITLGALQPPGPVPTPGPPIVAGIDLDVLRGGETVRVDGTGGTVELPGVAEVRVVTSFLERDDGRILLLRRSSRVGSFQGRWAAVSGFLEDPTPEEQARREIREETSIEPTQLHLEASGTPVYARDGMRVFSVHPFRFRVPEVDVVIDWEHSEFEWVDPGEIRRRETVPKLDRVWRAVASGA